MFSRLSYSLLVAALLPRALVAQEITDDWEFAASIYGWFPDISGDTAFAASSISTIDVDISSILDHLKMTGQGAFEIQKDHWGAFTDLIYLEVGESKSRTRDLSIGGRPLPASVTSRAELDLKTTLWTIGGSYRVLATPGASFDILLGMRLADLQQTLDWEFTENVGVAAPRSGTREESVNQWDAIVGIKGRFGLGESHNWVLPYYIDVGAGDSDFTWQAMLGLGYSFGWGDLTVAWRYLDYELKSDSAITDLALNGPALGVTFRW
jgi:hypothetical protein